MSYNFCFSHAPVQCNNLQSQPSVLPRKPVNQTVRSVFLSLAEAVNNMCGLGFNGFDEKGKPKWNGMANVNCMKLEVGKPDVKYTSEKTKQC